MTKRMKMIIPLIDKSFTTDDFSKEAGFVDAFDTDINKPYLDNHIFLMYDPNVKTKKSAIRYQKFSKLSTLYNRRIIRVNDKPYLVYAFVIVNNEVKRDKKQLTGNITLSKNKLRIMQFWKGNDEDVSTKLTKNTLWQRSLERSVPEEDWLPSLDDVFKCETNKGGAL